MSDNKKIPATPKSSQATLVNPKSDNSQPSVIDKSSNPGSRTTTTKLKRPDGK